MKLVAGRNIVKIVSRKEEELIWAINEFDRTRLSDIKDPYKEINEYFASRSLKLQDAIFDAYKSMYEVMYDIHDPKKLTSELIKRVDALYSLMPYETIEQWFRIKGEVKMPPDLMEEYNPGAPDALPRERTYLRSDYKELVVLAIALRPMVPIWGSYIGIIKDQAGTLYKEYTGMSLLAKCDNIMLSSPMQRLLVYISATMPREDSDEANALAAIVRGLGTVEMPEWLLSLVVIRRVCVGDVHPSDERGNLITNVYGYLTGVLKDIDKKFGGIIQDKQPMSESGKGDDQEESVVEIYKVKQEIPHGDIAIVSAYVSNTLLMARQIDPTIPEKLVSTCVNHIHKNQLMEILKSQEVLAQWIIAPIMSPLSISYLNRIPLLNVFGVTQSMLWHWGLTNLAAIMSSSLVIRPTGVVIAADVRMRIPNHLVDRLVELYRITHPADDKESERKLNVGCKSVRALAKEISGKVYKLNVPRDLRAAITTTVDDVGNMPAPTDLAESVARLAIHIAEAQCK